MSELSSRNRTLGTAETVAEELREYKNNLASKRGKSNSLYKQATDEHKGEQLQTDIANKIVALKTSDAKKRIEWDNLEEVKERTFEYLTACQKAEVYPSVMGLAVYGYGVSRQALNRYLSSHNNETTDFIERAKDIMSDILVNASLYNNANAVQVIFQLKNHYGHTDTVQLQPVVERAEEKFDAEAIRARYLITDEKEVE